MNYHKIILVGNVTRDAQRHTSKNGDVTYTTFRVAVSDGKGRTIFFPVTVFGKHGEAVAEYITKGRQLLVEGRIEVRTMAASISWPTRYGWATPVMLDQPNPKKSPRKPIRWWARRGSNEPLRRSHPPPIAQD